MKAQEVVSVVEVWKVCTSACPMEGRQMSAANRTVIRRTLCFIIIKCSLRAGSAASKSWMFFGTEYNALNLKEQLERVYGTIDLLL